MIDAAAAAGVQHVILASSLGTSDQKEFSELQLSRLGGPVVLSARRRVEEHLVQRVKSSHEHPNLVTMRHTILQAAPYATALQLEARRAEQAGGMGNEDDDDGVTAEVVETADSEGRRRLRLSRPLTSPEALAKVAVEAALYTRPNTLKRQVTLKCVSR